MAAPWYYDRMLCGSHSRKVTDTSLCVIICQINGFKGTVINCSDLTEIMGVENKFTKFRKQMLSTQLIKLHQVLNGVNYLT